ncbi:MAG: DNRLRE domain-containing protein [Planctomycetota bacterium]
MGQSFTVVALPDTQNYVNSSSNAPLFTQQTQWVADQIQIDGNPRNIQFVTHLGDMVSTGTNLTQWNRADTSMDVLDDVVKYSVLPGNHDYAQTGQKTTDTANYVSFFGPQRFASYDWYGGADPSGNNSFQRFSAGGYDFLHLALEWQPTINAPFRSPSPVDWAQSVINANPDTPIILSTHDYIDDSPNPGRSSAGEALWDQLIRRNDQVFLVLNGHNHGAGGFNDGEYHQVSTNDAGRPVFEVLQDYQDYANGGNGWLRLIEFDIAADRLRFETYSPVLDQFQTERIDTVGGFASEFEFAIDYADRLAPIILPPDPNADNRPPDFLFQEGVAGYMGTSDKELRGSGGDSGNGQADSISIDGSDSGFPNHVLIRFDDIIGDGPGQLPVGASIESATLAIEVTNPGSGFTVHDMLVGWNEFSTWASLGGGVQANDVEAGSEAVDTIGANNSSSSNVPIGTLEIDVTSTVEKYLDGSLVNRGWALLPFTNGTNGIDFFTSEFADLNARPALIIDTRDGDYDLDGDVDEADYDRWVADFGRTDGSFADGNRDGVVDLADYTIWRDALAASVDAIPEPSSSVVLVVAITVAQRRLHHANRLR